MKEQGLDNNTLVIFTSDNGPSFSGKATLLSGKKNSTFEGGMREPTVIRWPGKIPAGTVNDEIMTAMDILPTFARLAGAELPENAGEDSVSFLPALSGKPIVSSRAGIIHHSINGHFAYRQSKWKLLLAKGSGGWSAPREKDVPEGSPEAQLYDMENDPGETTNLYASQPEVVQRLLKLLDADVQRGRSTSGTDLNNDIKQINLWKSGRK